jgi:peptidyl-dipeptidase A
MQLERDTVRSTRFLGLIVCAGWLAACSQESEGPAVTVTASGGEPPAAEASRPAGGPTVDDARAFIADAERQLREAGEYHGRVDWVRPTYINFDTDWLAARSAADMTRLAVRLANETKDFEGLDLDPALSRKMNRLRTGITLPAPSRDGAAEELAELGTWLASTYSTGTFPLGESTLDLAAAEAIIESSRNPEELAAVWAGWRTVAEPMAEPYAEMVVLADEGARELGFADLAEMWLSGYEMSPAEIEAEVERLWGQVQPLYERLHCHVRDELNAYYGDAVQPASGLIRADLLGNMWAQSWNNIYDIVAPERAAATAIDLTQSLTEHGYTARQMVETGEAFFSSLGFEPLPETFWERSLIVRPRDRAADCHAAAGIVDTEQDVRIKMCTDVNAEDFRVVHHELGHVYYGRAYAGQDMLFRNGAHDGFHEAIGDFVALSITPEYLREIGLIDEVPDSSADIGLLLNWRAAALMPCSNGAVRWAARPKSSLDSARAVPCALPRSCLGL